jgi:hypothetical protein
MGGPGRAGQASLLEGPCDTLTAEDGDDDDDGR